MQGSLGALNGGVALGSMGLDGGASLHCYMALLAAHVASKDTVVHGEQWLESLLPLNTRW